MEQLVRNWGISYIGNQIGILGVIALLDGAGIFSYSTPGILSTAMTKVSLTFQQVMVILSLLLLPRPHCFQLMMPQLASAHTAHTAGLLSTAVSEVLVTLQPDIQKDISQLGALNSCFFPD